MLRLQSPLPEEYTAASPEDLASRIAAAKAALGSRLYILGHHYQRDEVMRWADARGDSFRLSVLAKEHPEAAYIVFCGVHFMAESADVLTGPHQQVVLPDLNAGCSMADMADIESVEEAWEALERVVDIESVVPITYMNSSAALKAFVGHHGGAVCTSTNARAVLEWAFRPRAEGGAGAAKVLFFPDQHLGRNTGMAMGYSLDDMRVWDPRHEQGGLDDAHLKEATFLLWKGHCSVHQRFRPEHVAAFREQHPTGIVVVHPECAHDVCELADQVGSTDFIIRAVQAAPEGAVIGVGTEIHLVNRLNDETPGKTIVSLDPLVCPCSTMFRIDAPPPVLGAREPGRRASRQPDRGGRRHGRRRPGGARPHAGHHLTPSVLHSRHGIVRKLLAFVPGTQGATRSGSSQAGSSTTASIPPPGPSSSRAVPPSAWTSLATMARPRPLPPRPLPVVEARHRRSKARVRCSADSPGPLSMTWRATRRPASSLPARRTTVPAGAASNALASRLSSTCATRSGSACTAKPAGTAGSSSTPRSSASGAQTATRSATSSRTSTSRAVLAASSAIGPGQHEQAVDEAAEPLDFADRLLQVRGPLRAGLSLRVLEPQPQRGERRPQLVGSVGDEGFLAAHQILEAFGRAVERAGQLAHLWRPLVYGNSPPQVAVADVDRGRLQLPERLGDGPGDEHAETGHRHEGHDRHAAEGQPVLADAVVHLGARVGDAHRPAHDA